MGKKRTISEEHDYREITADDEFELLSRRYRKNAREGRAGTAFCQAADFAKSSAVAAVPVDSRLRLSE